eukprot:Partr_v1_DN26342_c0_g1_i2_m43123 putative Suppressor of Ty 3 homolog (S. cerevisiae)
MDPRCSWNWLIRVRAVCWELTALWISIETCRGTSISQRLVPWFFIIPIMIACEFLTEAWMKMFTFGEVRHTQAETTMLVEDIVKSQIVEILLGTVAVARRRGSRHFSYEDIIFLIRRDRMKVARLSAYLSWRKVRRIANRTGAAGASGGPVPGTAGAAAGAVPDIDDDLVDDGGEAGDKKVKKQAIRLSWQLLDQFHDILAVAGSDDEDEMDGDGEDGDGREDDHIDMDEREFFQESRSRLMRADQITAAMNKQEYMEYAECRQASFTYKKPSRFRDWLRIDYYTGMKPNNDMLDILGFLCYEMVRTLTEQSLVVKLEMESRPHSELDGANGNSQSEHNLVDSEFLDAAILGLREQFKPCSIFTSPDERTPLSPVHVVEAYRRLQQNEHLSTEGSSYYDTISVRNDSRDCLRLFDAAGGKMRRNLI